MRERSSTSEAVKLYELTELAAVRLQQTKDIEALEAERERWQRDYYNLRDAFNALVRRMLSVFQSLRYQLAVQRSKDAQELIETQIDELSKLDPPPQEKHE